MTLLQQFQGVIGSLVIGGLFAFVYTSVKAFLNHKGIKWIWYFFQIVLLFSMTYIYYLFLCYYTYGIYNFFFTISFICGVLIYVFLYYPKYKKVLTKISSFIDKRLNILKLKVKRFFVKIISFKRRKHENKIKDNK